MDEDNYSLEPWRDGPAAMHSAVDAIKRRDQVVFIDMYGAYILLAMVFGHFLVVSAEINLWCVLLWVKAQTKVQEYFENGEVDRHHEER